MRPYVYSPLLYVYIVKLWMATVRHLSHRSSPVRRRALPQIIHLLLSLLCPVFTWEGDDLSSQERPWEDCVFWPYLAR